MVIRTDVRKFLLPTLIRKISLLSYGQCSDPDMASGVLSNSRHGSQSQVIEEIELGIAMASKDAQAEPPVPQSLATSVESHVTQSARNRYETVGFASILYFIFVMGWNDGTQGPLLPAIQAHYHVITFAGFICAHLINLLSTGRVYRSIHHFCLLLCSEFAPQCVLC